MSIKYQTVQLDDVLMTTKKDLEAAGYVETAVGFVKLPEGGNFVSDGVTLVPMKTAAQHNAEVVGTLETFPAPIGEARRSTDERKLNKTETAYLEYLRTFEEWVGVQCITLKLADDCRYTCDFWTVHSTGRLQGHEVKGFFRDDAKVKIKVAARMFPMFMFCIVTKEKGKWQVVEVKP